MKKLIALMALASMFAVGCKSDRGGTTESNYSTTGTTSDTGRMQDKATTQSQSTITTTNSNSNTQQQP
jgi:hypothetical protein